MTPIRAVFGVLLFLSLYFIPTGCAVFRRHPNEGAIFLLNLLAGWTFIGWVVAIVWAASAFRPTADE
jgi:hypothetical protein